MAETCTVNADSVSALFTTQQNLLYGMINKALPVAVPFLSVLEKGTFPNATAATLTATIQGRAAPADDMVFPTFTDAVSKCDSCGDEIANGANQYIYQSRIKVIKSEKICFNSGFHAVKGALISQFQALTQLVTEVINADVRAEMYRRSGVKAVVQAGVSPTAMIAGGYNQIDTPMPAIQSSARLTFGLLEKFAAYMRETLLVQTFGAGNGANLRFVAGWETLSNLRNDLGGAAGTSAVITPYSALAAGSDKGVQDSLKSFAFEPTYRGIEFAKDQRPMRADWTGAAYSFIQPELAVAGSTGTVGAPNPAWNEAGYEVSYLFGKGSFAREVPAPWVGEGVTKFANQNFGGQLQFVVPQGGDNLLRNYGVLVAQIGRAFRPLYPWFVLPIMHKRCAPEDAVVACYGSNGL